MTNTPGLGRRALAQLLGVEHRPPAPPVTEHEPAPPPGGWGDVLAQLARAQARVAELEADRDRLITTHLSCSAPELRREVAQLRARLLAKEAELERYRELDIARERAHGYGYQQGRADAEWPDAKAAKPVRDTPASTITDTSRPAGVVGQARTEVL